MNYEEWEEGIPDAIKADSLWRYSQRSRSFIDHRLQLLTEIIRLLLTMVPQQRGRTLREERVLYNADPDQAPPDTFNEQNLNNLLQHIPLP